MITESGLGDYLLDAANMGASDSGTLRPACRPWCGSAARSSRSIIRSLTANATRDMIYDLLSNDQRQRLENEWELDFSSAPPRSARFRVNVYFQRGALAQLSVPSPAR